MVAVLAAGGGIVGMFAVEGAVAIVNLAWIGTVASRHFRRLAAKSEPAPDLERAALRFAGLTTIGALLTFVVWKRSEFFFLAHYSSDAQIALYSIAFAVVTAVVVLPERLAIVATPVFARLRGAEDAVGIREGFGRTLRLMVLAMLPLAAGIVAVGPLFLELIYGDEYADVGPVLMILAAGLPFSAVSVASTSLLAGLEDAVRPADRRSGRRLRQRRARVRADPGHGRRRRGDGQRRRPARRRRRRRDPGDPGRGRPRVALGPGAAGSDRGRRVRRRRARRSSSCSAASRASSSACSPASSCSGCSPWASGSCRETTPTGRTRTSAISSAGGWAPWSAGPRARPGALSLSPDAPRWLRKPAAGTAPRRASHERPVSEGARSTRRSPARKRQ